ncbi:MAG TPA: hypothetical protein VFE47_13425 [Tepidisphaeraceae bacterium]|jgi:hypothetical protein|nr:hypothetical protein [Tepidisphaeraceae bacterium]
MTHLTHSHQQSPAPGSTSAPAVVSFMFAMVLLGLFVEALFAQIGPSAAPRWVGFPQYIGVALTLAILFVASLIFGPISILLACVALWKLRRERNRRMSKLVALTAILISAGIMMASAFMVF